MNILATAILTCWDTNPRFFLYILRFYLSIYFQYKIFGNILQINNKLYFHVQKESKKKKNIFDL